MNRYYDVHNHPIRAGSLIHCAINGDVERVHSRGDELGIMGDQLDDLPRSFFPLTGFGHTELSPGCYKMAYFEIIE